MNVQRYASLIAIIFTALGVAALGVLFGALLPGNLKLHWSFFTFVEILAVLELLVISWITYARIWRFYSAHSAEMVALSDDDANVNFIAFFLATGLTSVAALSAIMFASMPHLHIASLVVLVASFCIFDLCTVIAFAGKLESDAIAKPDSAVILFLGRVQGWWLQGNLPTFIGLTLLYATVLIFYLYPSLCGPYSHQVIEAFASGAAAFHIALSGVHFTLANRAFLIKGKLDNAAHGSVA